MFSVPDESRTRIYKNSYWMPTVVFDESLKVNRYDLMTLSEKTQH